MVDVGIPDDWPTIALVGFGVRNDEGVQKTQGFDRVEELRVTITQP